MAHHVCHLQPALTWFSAGYSSRLSNLLKSQKSRLSVKVIAYKQVESDPMAVDPRKLMAPAAAFTMAIIVIFYTQSSIREARRESIVRQRQELEAHRQEKLSRR